MILWYTILLCIHPGIFDAQLFTIAFLKMPFFRHDSARIQVTETLQFHIKILSEKNYKDSAYENRGFAILSLPSAPTQ